MKQKHVQAHGMRIDYSDGVVFLNIIYNLRVIDVEKTLNGVPE